MKRLMYLFVVMLFATSIVSCSDGDDGNVEPNFDDDEITDEEVAILQERIGDIDNMIDGYISKVTSIEEMGQYLDEIAQNPNVEKAWIENGALALIVKDGGLMFFDEGMPYDDIESRSSQNFMISSLPSIKSIVQDRKPVKVVSSDSKQLNAQPNLLSRSSGRFLHGCKNKKVLLFNTEKFAESDIKGFEAAFNSMSGVFDVTVVQGEECTAEFILDNFTEYGLILMVAHGNYIDGKHWIVTRDEYGFTSDIVELWKRFRFGVYRRHFSISEDDSCRYWAISEDEIATSMKGEFAENSILYAVTCHTFNSNEKLVDAFRSHGLGAFVGFNLPVDYPKGMKGFDRMLCDMVISRSSFDYSENGIEYKEISLRESYEENKNLYSNWGNETTQNTKMCISCGDDIAVFSTINSEQLVNLGLPSYWSGYNIGAKSAEESGNYYQLCDGVDLSQYKYDCTCSSNGHTYHADIPITADIAYKTYGNAWRLPTYLDALFLKEYSRIESYFIYNGVRGTRVTGPTGESIFFPYAGWYENDSYKNKGTTGCDAGFYPTNTVEYNEKESTGFSTIVSPGVYEYYYRYDCKYIQGLYFEELVENIGSAKDSYTYEDEMYIYKYPVRAVQDNPLYK